MGALDAIIRQGKALYVGISAYSPEGTREAIEILRGLGTRCLIHQPRYSMFDRRIEEGLLEVLGEEGVGCIVFSPLEQGLLTDKYLDGVPENSRAAKPNTYLGRDQVTEEKISKVRKLTELAAGRDQTLAQMAVAWVLRHPTMTSALIGASRVQQIEDGIAALDNLEFSDAELTAIEEILAGEG